MDEINAHCLLFYTFVYLCKIIIIIIIIIYVKLLLWNYQKIAIFIANLLLLRRLLISDESEINFVDRWINVSIMITDKDYWSCNGLKKIWVSFAEFKCAKQKTVQRKSPKDLWITQSQIPRISNLSIWFTTA